MTDTDIRGAIRRVAHQAIVVSETPGVTRAQLRDAAFYLAHGLGEIAGNDEPQPLPVAANLNRRLPLLRRIMRGLPIYRRVARPA